MQFRRNLPGRGSTDFYFTEESAGGMTTAQQEYIADLVMAYREKYPDLAVNAVWDFGMEEGDPVRGEKYGVFADSRDNAVYNASMLTISFNHARLRRMPLEIPEDEFTLISSCLSKYRDLPETAFRMQAEFLAKGVPWPQIDGMIRENLGITACAENALPVTDPYFGDVQVIRMLENAESLKRLVVHEIGHMLSEESGAISDKRIRKLYGKCRDGFENLYEFCAECFMASELMDGIVLAQEYARTIRKIAY